MESSDGNFYHEICSHFPVEKWDQWEMSLFHSRELNGLAYRIGTRYLNNDSLHAAKKESQEENGKSRDGEKGMPSSLDPALKA